TEVACPEPEALPVDRWGAGFRMGGMTFHTLWCFLAAAPVVPAVPLADAGDSAAEASLGRAPTGDFNGRYPHGLQPLQLGEPGQAIVELKAATQIEPTRTAGFLALARALAAAGNLDEAANAYAQCLKLEPNNDFAREELGLTRRRLNDANGAIDQFREALK